MPEIDSASLPPVVDDSSFEAWEASQPKAAPAQQPQAEEKPATPSVPGKGETVAATEAAPAQEHKQQARPVERKRDAESTIHKKDREIADLRKQLEDFRKNAATPQETRPAPESRQPASQPERLGKLSDYVRAEARKRPDALQEDLIEEWVHKRDAEAEQVRQVRATGDRINKAMSDFRAKHPDAADAVFNELTLGTPQVNVMRPLMENIPNWTDVLHYLHENRDVYDKVIKSSPQDQWNAAVAISWNLSNGFVSVAKSPAEPAQEQPRNKVHPISRIPAPAKHTLGGGMPPDAKNMRDARDFEEAEYLESRRLASRR